MNIKKSHITNGVQLILLTALILCIGFLTPIVSPVILLGAIAAIGLLCFVWKQPWMGFLMFVFFLPFERIGSIDVGGLTIRPSHVIAALLLITILARFASAPQEELPRNQTVLPMCIFVVLALLSLFHAPNTERSVLVLVFIVFTFAMSCVVPLLVTDMRRLHQLLRVLFFSFFLVCAFGVFQFVGDWLGLPQTLTGLRDLYTKDVLGFPRVQSTALEPLYFANYLLVPLSIALSLYFAQDRSIKLRTLLLLIGLGGLNLLLTVARGGYIACAVSVLLLLLYYFRYLWTPRNIIIGSVGLAMGIVVLIQLVNVEAVTEKFTTHVTNLFTGASYVERIDTFTIAWRAVEEHPLIGIGPGSFGPFSNAHPYLVPAQGWRIVNNEYLELLAEHGVFGLAAMLLVWCAVIIRSVKAIVRTRDSFLRAVLVGTLAGFLGILVQYNTFSVLYIAHIWFTVGLLIALQNRVISPTHV